MKRVVRYIVFFIVVGLVALVLISLMRGAESAMRQCSAVIVIDAGHGGFDGGAIGRFTNVHEAGLNLAAAKKLEKLCVGAGYAVIMTRADENAIGDTKDSDMAHRQNIIEEANADMVVSIHMNKYPDSSVSGPQVFYYDSSAEGEILAESIQQQLNAYLMPQRARAHKPENYFILRASESPCVIVECGFLSNEREERLLQTDDYQQLCAQAIYEGIKQYLHLRADDGDGIIQ